MKEFAIGLVALGVGIAIFIGIFWAILWGWQYFKVFTAQQSGRAELVQAEQNRQIVIEEAKAANEAATLQAEARIKQETANAQAEVIRAQGVADANRIIGEGLKGNEDYLRYLWIQSTKGQQVIYIPTEAGLPILEAGKR